MNAIQPTSIMQPSWQKRLNDGTYGSQVRGAERRKDGIYVPYIAIPPSHPDLAMRKKGFNRNPAICLHLGRKRFTTRWICLDCGSDI